MSDSGQALVERTAPPHPAPVGPIALWFGVLAAPLLWFAQLLWNYSVTALACFPAETPNMEALYGWTRTAVFACDIAAILTAVAGCAVSYGSWRKSVAAPAGTYALDVFDDRAHFMAIWGMLFSFGFLVAIIFETIASVTVKPCGI